MMRWWPLSGRSRAGALTVGLVIVVLAAMGAVAVAVASGTEAASSAAVTGAISLESKSILEGGTVHGTVVFENSTTTNKVLLQGCKIDGLFAIGFRAADGYLAAPAFSLVGCDESAPGNELIAKPGITTFHFQARATYMQCGQDPKNQLSRSAKYWSPLCLKDHRGMRDVMPPLPAGAYVAQFFPAGTWKGPKVQPASFVISGKRP